MKAWLSHQSGGPETLALDDVAEPAPGPGKVLVRVAATSLNFPDALMIEDLYQFRPERPFAPGGEIGGTVATVGEGVTNVKPGDRVCALCGHGGLAEFATADAWRTFRIPDAMPFEVGSTLLMTYGTNIHAFLDRCGLTAGESLLVLGAAGGIGLSAVELGTALGAHVVGAVSSPEKREAVLRAGAEDVIVYPRPPFDKAASKALADSFKAAGPSGYDVVYDPVGGPYAEPALRSIGWEGRYAVVGFTAGIPSIALNLALLKACSIVGVFWGAWTQRNPERFAEEMAMLFGLWSEGKIKPLIPELFAFEDAPRALARLRGRTAVGKLVVAGPGAGA